VNQTLALELYDILATDQEGADVEAANWFFKQAGIEHRVKESRAAQEALYSIYVQALNRNLFPEAATMIWGQGEVFDSRPRSVRRIWEGLAKYSKILIPGSGSQGKSYNSAAWAVLWWTQDPFYTSIKVVSVTSVHASANVLATIKTLHEASVLKLPGRRMDKKIDLADGNERSTIALVSLPQGPDVKGRLRGFHPVPRPYHPIFGTSSRIGVIIDEGEDVPVGVWEGLQNILSTEDKTTHNIKIVSGANPKKRESAFAARCEFPGGWMNYDMEVDEEWDGPESLGKWHVIRLDASKTENVQEKRTVYPRLMTYEGYLNYVRLGTNHADYYTFARGTWPEATAEFRITSPEFFNNSRGILTFDEGVQPIASLDPAFALGGDKAMLTTGKYGYAIGFTNTKQEYEKFEMPRKMMQIEQQISVPKDNTLIMARYVIDILRHLRVRPEYFIMDKTGNGWGLHDAITQMYGNIYGMQWSEAASERKILEEDTGKAEDKYSGVVSEMCFAFAAWLEFGYIKFAPILDLAPLVTQATNRKYSYQRGLQRAESKDMYKLTSSGASPDEYDSAIMLVHLIRLRESQKAQMVVPEQRWKEAPVNEWDQLRQRRKVVTNPDIGFVDVLG
jgi:hypothetical protein